MSYYGLYGHLNELILYDKIDIINNGQLKSIIIPIPILNLSI